MEQLENRQLLSATLAVSQSLMVFNAVQNSAASQTETLTLTNTGNATLSLSGVSVVDDPSATAGGSAHFSVINASSEPATLAPGVSFTLQLDYTATAKGLDAALLDISSSDPVNPLQQVSLHGIGTTGTGGTNQPSLLRILQAYDIPTQVGETDVTNSQYPNPPAGNSQEVSMQQLVAANASLPVTINVLASFTNSEPKPYILGYYSPGDPTDKTQLFYTPTSESQSVYVQPSGITSFSPGSARFGMYFYSSAYGYYGYSEDALNTFDTTNNRKFRFFPMETANGTVVPNQYIMTSTEYKDPSGYDFTNIVAIISNVTAAPSANTGPVINITHSNPLPGSNTLMFNDISIQNTSVGDTVHASNTVTISNTGTSPLTISSATLSDTTDWTLSSSSAFPITVADGASTTLTINFIATSKPSTPYNETDGYVDGGNDGGVYNGTLTIASNDPVTPSTAIPLRGYWQYKSENVNEPSLQTIVNLMAGWGTNIDSSITTALTQSTASNATPTYYGEEVVSAYWAQVDSTQPVSVIQLAAFHTQGSSGGLDYYAQGSTSLTSILYDNSDSGQSLFPLANGSSSSATGSFSKTGNFGFDVVGPAGPSVHSDDSLNTDADGVGGGHGMRFYPVRDGNGNLIPNTYICTIDYFDGSSTNFDFQDEMFVISNIRPVTSKAVSAPQTAASAAAPMTIAAVANANSTNSLQWIPVYADSTLTGYNIYSSQSATSGFTKLNSALLATPSYTDLTPLTGTTLYYRVTAVDSSGESLGTQTSVLTAGTAPAGLQSIAIDETPAGSTTNNTANSAYTVVAGGPGITGTSDGFRYIYEQQTGNFDVAVQVNSLTVAGNYSTAGILARTALTDTSPDVYMAATPVNYKFKYRSSDGGNTTIVSSGTTSFPNVWVRLTRVGNVFTGYTSTNGGTWTALSSVTLALPATLYLGLAVASNTNTTTTTANLSNYGATSSLSGPVVYADSFSTTSGQPTSVNVLNSADFDRTGTIEPTTISIVSAPTSGGTATVDTSNGLVTYTSPAGFVGSDTFTYTVADSNGAVSSPVTVTVTVAAAGPNAVADTANAVAGQAVVINVLANDTDSTGTLNPASVTIGSLPTHGSVSVNTSTGAITYTAAGDYSGNDTFSYSVADYNGAISPPATVTVAVTAAASTAGPVTNPVAVTATAGVLTSIDVLASDSDAAAALVPSSVHILSAPNHGGTATVDTTTGNINYTAAAHYSGTETFTYTVADSAGNTSAATLVTVTVRNPAVAPIASNSASTTTVGTATTVSVVSNVESSVGLNLGSIAITVAPTYGTTAINTSTGVITYTPNAGYVGPDSFNYTVADTNGHTSNASTVTLSTGLMVGNVAGNDRSVSFTGAGGVATTLTLNRGSVETLFATPGTVTVDRLGRATVVASTASPVTLGQLELSGTTAASVLGVGGHGGTGTISIAGITDSTPIGVILSPRGMLSGTINLAGVSLLSAVGLASAHITLGSAFPAGASLLVSGGILNSSLVSAAPLKLIRSANWTGSLSTSTITAPSIGTLITSGVFEAMVTLTSPGVDLNVAEIGSSDNSAWHLSGSARTFLFSGALDGTVSVAGGINAMVIRKGGFDGAISAGSVNVMSISGNIEATISAGTINALLDAGDLTNSDVNVAGTLKTLSVSGQIGGSTIDAGATMNTVVASSLVASTLEAGVASTVTLGNVSSGSIGGGIIRSVNLRGRSGDEFSDAVILAGTLGPLSLGTIDTSSNAGTEGIAATSIATLSANVSGTAVRQRAATLPAYLAANASLFSEFQVKLV
jgi:hypothetical protein